jgi:hypothetical protein
MSSIEPQDQLKRDIDSLQSSLNSLQSKVRLSDRRDAVEDLQTTIAGLAQRVNELRRRGYAFGKHWADQATDLEKQWGTLRPAIYHQIEVQAALLQQALRPVEDQFRNLVAQSGVPSVAQRLLPQVKAAISTVEGKVSAASSSINGMYDSLEQKVDELQGDMQKVDWMLQQIGTASFQLLATEAGVMAVKATWVKGDKEDQGDPQGVLYLTDQRLLFEQKQEIVTKRTLFIVREKEKVQKLLLDVAVGLVDKVKASKRGLLGHEDHLELTFTDNAAAPAHFHIDGQDCNKWQELIGRVKAGDLEADRAVALDEAIVERVRSAPTTCPHCGGAITTKVLRGMDSIQCEYCGKLIRL